MKTLKKPLSLIIAIAMILSVCVLPTTVFAQNISLSANAAIGEVYTLPTKHEGTAIAWEGGITSLTPDKIGITKINGTCGADTVTLTLNTGYYETLISEDMEKYDAGAKPQNLNNAGIVAYSPSNSVEFENGVSGNKVLKISKGQESNWPNSTRFDGLVLPEAYSGSFRVSFDMRFNNQTSELIKRTAFIILQSDYSKYTEGTLGGLWVERSNATKIRVKNTVKGQSTSGSDGAVEKYFSKNINEKFRLSLVFDDVNKCYDTYADGVLLHDNIPYDFNPGFVKYILFISRGALNSDIFFDNIKFEKLITVKNLPDSIDVTIPQGEDTQKEFIKTVPATMSDGSVMYFAAKYTANTTIASQTVDGSIDGFSDKIPVNVTVMENAATVTQIKSALADEIFVGESYVLPKKLSVSYSDSTTGEVYVAWNPQLVGDTSASGTKTFKGRIDGSDEDITFTLTIKEDTPQRLETPQITADILKNQAFLFPTDATVIMESGAKKFCQIDWGEQTPDIEVSGTHIYTGTVDGQFTVTLTLNVSDMEYGVVYTSEILSVGDSYKLPAKLEGKAITWNDRWDSAEITSPVNTDNVGNQIFKAVDSDGTRYNHTVYVGIGNELVSDNMESYTENEQPDYPIAGGGIGLSNSCFIAKDPVDADNLAVKINGTSTWGNFNFITPTLSVNDYIFSGKVYIDGDKNNDGPKILLYSKDYEIGGIVFYQKTDTKTLNIRNGRMDGSGESGVDGIKYESPRWIDFKIVVDVSELTYDVYADGLTIRKDVSVTSDEITTAELAKIKTVKIAQRNSTTGEVYFDDLAITQYTYVTGKLPDALFDNVVVLDDDNAQRVQTISLMQNNGEMRELTVNYTVDLTTSGTQNVMGEIAGFSEKIPVEVNVDARTIDSIDDIYLSVYEGATDVLPKTVTVILSDGTQKELNISWDEGSTPDTSNPTPEEEPQVFMGTVTGWNNPVTLYLTVLDDKPVEVTPITKEVTQYDEYSLPNEVDVVLESMTTDKMGVDWNGQIAKTHIADVITYEGFVKGYPDITVTLTLTVNPAEITGISYGDIDSDGNIDETMEIFVQTVEHLPKTVACTTANGAISQVEVDWDTSSIEDGFITGIAAGYTVNANVKLLEFPKAALNDGLDTLCYDTEFQDKKFKHGMPLRLSPFTVGNFWEFKCVNDPTGEVENPDNLVMRYRCDPSFPGNYNKHYETITMEEGKCGLVLMEMDMWMPYDFTEFRVRLLSGGGGEVVVLTLYGKDRTISKTKGAFPVEEWFRLGILTDSSALTKEQLANGEKGTYSFYINGVLIEEGLEWRGTATETNELGKNIKSINFANREDDSFTCYLDNANLYFFNDYMKDAMNSVNYISDTDPEETFYNDLYEDDGNIIWDTPYSDGTQISWKSNKPSVISNDGTVNYPAFGQYSQAVTMTATFKNTVGGFNLSEDVPYLFRVFPRTENSSDNEANALNTITLPSSTDKDNIELPTEINGVKISWTSSNSSVLDEKGRVYNPQTDTDVTLTASTSAGATRTFTIRVLHQSNPTDIQKVRTVLKSLTVASQTSTSLSLPTSIDGVSIVWISGNTSVMSHTGAIQSGNHNTEVVLTARASVGNNTDSIDEKSFIVKVVVTNQGSGDESSGGGAGGGGGFTSNAQQVTPTIPTVPTISSSSIFNDVSGYEWAHEAIDVLYQKGIINGVTENSYMPAANILREQYAALIVRLLKLEGKENNNYFSDVKESDWFCKEINIAYESGIISGVGNNMAGTGYNITREDMAVILYNAAKFLNMAGSANNNADFKDFDDISQYAKEAVSFLAEKGVINGSDGKMLPKNYATRAEAAKMIYEFIKVFDVENAQSDNSNDVSDLPQETDAPIILPDIPDKTEEIEEVDSLENQNEMDSMNDSIEQAKDTLQKEEILTED